MKSFLNEFANNTDALCDLIAATMKERDVYKLRAALNNLCGEHKYDILVDDSRGSVARVWYFREYVEQGDENFDGVALRTVEYQSKEWHWFNDNNDLGGYKALT